MQELVRSCFSRGDLRLPGERADRGKDGPGIKNTREGAAGRCGSSGRKA